MGIRIPLSNSRKYLIQAFKTIEGHYYWNLKGPNNKILASSPMITTKENCLNTANMVAHDILCQVKYIDQKDDYEL